jgi:chorismate mutase
MNLVSIRKKINSIDVNIVKLVAKRQACMSTVGKYKKQNKLPIDQPDREAAIIAVLTNLSKKERVDPQLIEDIFSLIFMDSKKIQRKIKI